MARAGYEDEQAAVDGTFVLALEDLKLACKDCPHRRRRARHRAQGRRAS
jgi:hypothetical protein